MRIFVVGAGATGGLLAQILRRRGHEVVCGDRDPIRAQAFLGRNIECRVVNARYYRSIAAAAQGSALLVNAAPAVFNEAVLKAALKLGTHYLDMAAHLNRNAFKPEQLKYHNSFVRRERLALIVAGAAPGLTNLMAAHCAGKLDRVDSVRIRLFEETESATPVSTWSAEVAHDEAISKPRVYRQGRFWLARRFSRPEWFKFPKPIGATRVVLAAQDEVCTLPYYIPMRELDVKIGGNEIERLRRWQRQGKLAPSDQRSEKHFPATATPAEVAALVRSGKLENARFAACVIVCGVKDGQPQELRHCCMFPSLQHLLKKMPGATPVAFAAAQSAAAFIEHFPRDLAGVYPPEALPRDARGAVLRGLSRRGFRLIQSASSMLAYN